MSTARGTLALTALLIAALPLGAEDTGDRKTALTHTLVPGVRCDELWNRNWPRTLHDKHITGLEACSAFTCVTACLLATSPYAMLSIRGFDGFVASAVAPTATGSARRPAEREFHLLRTRASGSRKGKLE